MSRVLIPRAYKEITFSSIPEISLWYFGTVSYTHLNDGGKVDEDRLTDFANFVGLLNQYSDPALLVSGTYDQQILNFSSGKYAFVTQGSWIGATMTGDDADAYKEAGNFEVGMIPYAFEDGIDTILTNSPSWWSVYKDGNVEAAEAFLQWLTTDEAQEVLVKEAGFVSPFKSCTIVGDDPFAQTITDLSLIHIFFQNKINPVTENGVHK